MKNTAQWAFCILSLAVFFVPVFAIAQVSPSYSFYNSQWGPLTPDTYCATPSFGCNDASANGVLSGTTLTGGTHDISFLTSIDAGTNAVHGTTYCAVGGGGVLSASCNANLAVEAASLPDGTYFALNVSPAFYYFFTVTGHVVGNAPYTPPNWNALTFPVVYSTSSAAIAASSTLWGAFASTSALVATCNSGNLFGDALCSAFSYLFVPNPNTVSQFTTLPTMIEARFPVSWVVGVQATIGGLTASSTQNMATFAIDWNAMQIGTSSPLGLAHIAPASTTVFSKQTIETYIPDGTWQMFQAWIAFAIWLTFAADVFFTTRNQMHRV